MLQYARGWRWRAIAKVHVINLESGQVQVFHRELIGIEPGIHHPLDSGVDDHLGASDTWLVRDIDGRTLKRNAVLGPLENGILLGMKTANAVASDDFASFIQAVWQSFGRTVIAGRQNTLVLDNNRADLGAQAGRALGYLERNVYEIIIPIGSRHKPSSRSKLPVTSIT